MSHQRNRFLFILLISLSIVFCAHAQDSVSEQNSLRAGAWALQFSISSNFRLTSFQGSTFSFKYQLSEKHALRAGITINGNTNTGSSSTTSSIADSITNLNPTDNSSDAANVSFVVQYLWYKNPSGPVHVYFGLGPLISYASSHNSSSSSNLRTDAYYDTVSVYHYFQYWQQAANKSNSKQWGIGLTAAVGVEWFACHWLSIRAEYSEGVQYLWSSTSSTTDYSYAYPSSVPVNYYHYPSTHSDNSGTNKGWTVNSSGVDFGLSVYW
jgi:hypothetical protein